MDEVVDVLTGLVAVRGAREHLRMDNGAEKIAWALRDYCRLAGTRTAFIEPGSRRENAFVESFNSRVRDELFNVEEFATLLEAQVLVCPTRAAQRSLNPPSQMPQLSATTLGTRVNRCERPDPEHRAGRTLER